jgi:hypothetical protein
VDYRRGVAWGGLFVLKPSCAIKKDACFRLLLRRSVLS